MVKVFSNMSSEEYINGALDKIAVDVHLGINDMFNRLSVNDMLNCLNVLLKDWEYLQPEQKEIVSDLVDEFIIKIIDDDI